MFIFSYSISNTSAYSHLCLWRVAPPTPALNPHAQSPLQTRFKSPPAPKSEIPLLRLTNPRRSRKLSRDPYYRINRNHVFSVTGRASRRFKIAAAAACRGSKIISVFDRGAPSQKGAGICGERVGGGARKENTNGNSINFSPGCGAKKPKGGKECLACAWQAPRPRYHFQFYIPVIQ